MGIGVVIAFLRSLGGRAVFVAGVAILAIFFAYTSGRSDCANKHRRIAAKEAAVWAEKIRVSEAAAYARGLQAANVEGQNEKTSEKIRSSAAAEHGAADICISGAIVEQLRNLE